MDNFLETYSPPKLNQEETDDLNRPITRSKLESVIKKKFPTNKSPGPVGFTGEFYQTYKEFILILLKLFQKIEEEGTLPETFYEATVTLIPKPEKDTTTTKKIKLQANIFDEYRCKNSQQNISKLNPTTYKKDHTE